MLNPEVKDLIDNFCKELGLSYSIDPKTQEFTFTKDKLIYKIHLDEIVGNKRVITKKAVELWLPTKEFIVKNVDRANRRGV